MVIKLQGVRNIRNFSEYGFPGYIRSAHLHDMTEKDARVLIKEYNLKTVIDLRTETEKDEQPDRVMEDVGYFHIPLFDEAKAGISHEKDTQRMSMKLPDMADLYRDIVTDEHSIMQIRKVMEIIGDNSRSGAVLWHCTEGKDRCGIISAVFLLSKGVGRDIVMRDYLKTNETAEDRSEYYYKAVLEKTGNEDIADKVRNIFLAKKEYMDPILGILETL